MVKKEKIIEKLKKLLKDNDVENPNFETASFFKKGIEEIIEQEAEQNSKKSKLSVTITPSGILNASKIILPKIIEDGLKKIESEKDEQENVICKGCIEYPCTPGYCENREMYKDQEDKPQTIEEAYKFCSYLENICKESLSPNNPCNEECKKELQQLKEKIYGKPCQKVVIPKGMSAPDYVKSITKEEQVESSLLIQMNNFKKDMTQDQINGVFGDTQNSKVICECGHEEGVHHHHMSYAWGAGSLCTRCTECIWDMNKGCYTFKERKIK